MASTREPARTSSMYCWRRRLNSRVLCFFLNVFLFSAHHAKHSIVLFPFLRLVSILAHCTKTSTSTKSSIPFSRANILALSPNPFLSNASTNNRSSRTRLHLSYPSSTKLGIVYRSCKCAIRFLLCDITSFSSLCRDSSFRFRPCIRVIMVSRADSAGVPVTVSLLQRVLSVSVSAEEEAWTEAMRFERELVKLVVSRSRCFCAVLNVFRWTSYGSRRRGWSNSKCDSAFNMVASFSAILCCWRIVLFRLVRLIGRA